MKNWKIPLSTTVYSQINFYRKYFLQLFHSEICFYLLRFELFTSYNYWNLLWLTEKLTILGTKPIKF